MQFIVNKSPGGTRKFNYHAKVPRTFLGTLPSLYQSIQLRKLHREEGRTNMTQEAWAELGRQIADCKMVVFVIVVASVLETITPYAFNLQNVAQLPSSRLKAQAELHKHINKLKTVLTLDIPKFFTWFHLILPYVSRDDMSRFLSVWRQWKYRCVPLLAASASQLIMEGRSNIWTLYSMHQRSYEMTL